MPSYAEQRNAAPTLPKNPRLEEIDHAWRGIKQDLDAGRGRFAADALAEIRNEDRPMWNALYWRVANYFAFQFIKHRPDGEADRRDRGKEDYTRFIHGLYAEREFPPGLNTDDIPYILQEIRRHHGQQ